MIDKPNNAKMINNSENSLNNIQSRFILNENALQKETIKNNLKENQSQNKFKISTVQVENQSTNLMMNKEMQSNILKFDSKQLINLYEQRSFLKSTNEFYKISYFDIISFYICCCIDESKKKLMMHKFQNERIKQIMDYLEIVSKLKDKQNL